MSHPQALVVAVRNAGGSLLPDNNTHTHRFDIPSASSDKMWTIAQHKTTGQWQCSCPSWVFKKGSPKPPCKHLVAIMPVLNTIKSLPGF